MSIFKSQEVSGKSFALMDESNECYLGYFTPGLKSSDGVTTRSESVQAEINGQERAESLRNIVKYQIRIFSNQQEIKVQCKILYQDAQPRMIQNEPMDARPDS